MIMINNKNTINRIYGKYVVNIIILIQSNNTIDNKLNCYNN